MKSRAFDPSQPAATMSAMDNGRQPSAFAQSDNRVNDANETVTRTCDEVLHLLARVAGFSLHAASVCEAHRRSHLQRLWRYITRPPIATKRLSVNGWGRVVYQYKHPFRDESTRKALLWALPIYKLSQFRTWPGAVISSDEIRTNSMTAIW
jgi:hypothetical protein